ncbi:hypothetical protein [Paracoccus chinensis]|uniref:Uncharacterized protein n=1 Tax=Paracoccus chinensis TaxID=525640 RepID=A0A1G9MP67_9RHOB|nr:hypothetical protein [Paracoccus chinensis]SDL75811.1 hypothetical protein SAMN04487971_12225 [Paracoccus chinensis]
MPRLPARSKTIARPVLSESDHAARGRRLTDRKAAEYRRTRDRQAARGEVEFSTWVPEAHAALIRTIVMEICRAHQAGWTSSPILSWELAEAMPASQSEPSQTDTPPGHETCGEGADDPAAWRGMGLTLRRRAQARRARDRKRAAGLTRIRLIVPQALKPDVSKMVGEIRAGLEEGLLPRLSAAPTVEQISNPRHAGETTEVPAPGRPSGANLERKAEAESRDIPEPAAARSLGLAHPPSDAKPASAGRNWPPPPSGSPEAQKWLHDLFDRHGAADLSSGDQQQASTLFDDVQALNRLPSLFAADPEVRERDR